MIRSAVDAEFFLDGGIVCIHAHIYTDTVAASQHFEEEIAAYFRELYARLQADERTTTDPKRGMVIARGEKEYKAKVRRARVR
jgi:hypothetical protein